MTRVKGFGLLAMLFLALFSLLLAGCGGGSSSSKSNDDQVEQPDTGGSDDSGDDDSSGDDDATDDDPAPPAAPSSLQASAGDGEVLLAWSAVEGAVGYRIQFSTNAGAAAAGDVITTVTTNSFLHSGLINGETYYYVVFAIDAAGQESPATVEALATPVAAQVVLTITLSGSGSGAVQDLTSGVNCASTCSLTLATGTQLTLSAVPDGQSDFVAWGNQCSGNDVTCSLLVSGNSQVTAEFASQSVDLIAGRYQIDSSNDGVVKDVNTGLEWMRCTFGKTWNSAQARCDGAAQQMSLGEAETQSVQFAGSSDWRVPTQEELQSLVYCSSSNPALFNTTGQVCNGTYAVPVIFSEVFPNTESMNYWSSTRNDTINTVARGINFENGFNSSSNVGVTYPVRYVRTAN